MSGNRANAAARNRRAGGGPEMQAPPRPPLRPGQQPQMTAEQMQPKPMSIQSAISLITLRLGRLETFMQKAENDNLTGEKNVINDGSRMVDGGVFTNIVSRLDALEKGRPATTSNQVTSNNQVSEEVSILKAEISQVKDLLLKLQSFTMETNKKLLDVVMQEEEQGSGNGFFIENNEDLEQDYAGQDLSGSLNVNLKEIIQKELSSV